jgi:hypothetical protein
MRYAEKHKINRNYTADQRRTDRTSQRNTTQEDHRRKTRTDTYKYIAYEEDPTNQTQRHREQRQKRDERNQQTG